MRETEWKDTAAWETDVVRPYLEAYNCCQDKWLEIINRRSQVIMQTNSEMQVRLSEQMGILKSLRKELASKEAQWEEVQEQLREGKDRQAQAEEQLRELREARLAEEVYLRDRNVALHQKLMALTESQRRLEDQKREDDRRAARNKELLEELRFMKAKLELRKSEFEFADEFESQQDVAGTDMDSETCSMPPEDIPAIPAAANPRDSLASWASELPSREDTPLSQVMAASPRSVSPFFDDGTLTLRMGTPPPQRRSPPPGGRASPGAATLTGSDLAALPAAPGDSASFSGPVRQPSKPSTPHGKVRPYSSARPQSSQSRTSIPESELV